MPELVSILMPVFQAEKTLSRAINSCIQQTYPHFEIVLLLNGIDPLCLNIIQTLNEPRIKLLTEPVNTGIAAARNRLLREAKGEFVAFLDADDAMLPDRLEKQVAYFQAHPETDLLGTWIVTQDHEVKKAPLHHPEISACLWFKNCMYQPSMMCRNFFAKEQIYYPENFANSVEDYALWFQLKDFKTFANLPLALTQYTVSSEEELKQKRKHNDFELNLHQLWQSKWQNLPIAPEYKATFQSFLYENKTLNEVEIKSLLSCMAVIKQNFKSKEYQYICAFHQLRIWRNSDTWMKIKYAYLLLNLRYYKAFKPLYLRA